MDGREFLTAARRLLQTKMEADLRSATSRAYYALMHEAKALLLQWGFAILPRENVHTFVRLRFSYAQNVDTKEIGRRLDKLVKWRNAADYQLTTIGPFGSDQLPQQAVDEAKDTIALLDALDANSARRAAAIAAIQAAWP
jgi:uncharacterized protein (UPF0332 family)